MLPNTMNIQPMIVIERGRLSMAKLARLLPPGYSIPE